MRTDNKQLAEEILTITKNGKYIKDNKEIDFSVAQRKAEQLTQLYRPETLEILSPEKALHAEKVKIEVTAESTQESAFRLAVLENKTHIALLNFASAKNVGGGFLGGAKAQEEDLCRHSGLYLCQLTQPDYYQENKKCQSMLYTDNMIYSPDVPFFRLNHQYLSDYFFASVITSPAPNAGEYLKRENPNNQLKNEAVIEEVFIRRAKYLLNLAKFHDHRILILGAWGCGVFRNSPEMVAKVFAFHLNQPEFSYYFERIIFAIYDKSPNQKNIQAFQKVFIH